MLVLKREVGEILLVGDVVIRHVSCSRGSTEFQVLRPPGDATRILRGELLAEDLAGAGLVSRVDPLEWDRRMGRWTYEWVCEQCRGSNRTIDGVQACYRCATIRLVTPKHGRS